MIPQQGSLVKPTLDQLEQLLTASRPPALQDLQVLYGPPSANDQVSVDVLQIAPGDFDQAGVTVTRTREPGAGRIVYRTETEVFLWLATYTGDTDMKALVEHADEIYDWVKSVVDANQGVAGVWDSIRLGTEETWSPAQTSQGATVVVLFSVVATALG